MQCIGMRARRAAISQDDLFLVIPRGLRKQLILDGRMRANEVGIVSEHDRFDEASDDVKAFLVEAVQQDTAQALGPATPRSSRPLVCKFDQNNRCLPGAQATGHSESWALKFSLKSDRYVDDLAGLPLRPDLCKEARRQ